MAVFSTLHIFGYGETQLIKENYNKKVLTSALTKAQAVVDDVYSHKPQGSTATSDYHAVNVFYNMFADYQPKEGDSFRTEYKELDSSKIDALVAEIEALPDPE